MAGYDEELIEFTKKLNNVSPSFCSAKWLQTTLHLQNGRTHSCHHPSPHAIPATEIATNGPTALHNTSFKKEQRAKMLKGERPDECQYCWNIEDLPGEHISDRPRKSFEFWAKDKLENIIATDANENVLPTYLEVSFSNLCNFKCSYCSPVNSSQWVHEIESKGPFMLGSREHNGLDFFKESGQLPIRHDTFNPYVDAFWKWWRDELAPNKALQVLRVTGGEPVLSKEFSLLTDALFDNPQPQMEFCINTNMGFDENQMKFFIERINLLTQRNLVKNITIHTSCDAHGKQAEYIRNGLDYQRWIDNVSAILTIFPTITVNVMCTTNIFSITSMDKFLADILAMKLTYTNEQRPLSVSIDFGILRWPGHQSLSILPSEFADLWKPAQEFITMWREDRQMNYYKQYDGYFECENEMALYKGFFDWEKSKFQRVVDYTYNPPNQNEMIALAGTWRDFYQFVDQHDKRRGTNFLETFPELEDFYQLCKYVHRYDKKVYLNDGELEVI